MTKPRASRAKDTLLEQFAQAQTRAEQDALIDQLLLAWADTSGLAGTMDDRDPDNYRMYYARFGAIRREDHYITPVVRTASSDAEHLRASMPSRAKRSEGRAVAGSMCPTPWHRRALQIFSETPCKSSPERVLFSKRSTYPQKTTIKTRPCIFAMNCRTSKTGRAFEKIIPKGCYQARSNSAAFLPLALPVRFWIFGF
jgi:hypothetical protein